MYLFFWNLDRPPKWFIHSFCEVGDNRFKMIQGFEGREPILLLIKSRNEKESGTYGRIIDIRKNSHSSAELLRSSSFHGLILGSNSEDKLKGQIAELKLASKNQELQYLDRIKALESSEK